MDYARYQEWLKTPNINPLTGRKIKINGPTYNKYESECKRLTIVNKPVDTKFKTRDEYIKYISSNCYNMSDPISLEDFEDMSIEQLSNIIFTGTGEKTHAFSLDSLQSSIKTGNLRHPVTNIKFSNLVI